MSTDRLKKRLADDGWEDLGGFELGAVVVVGDLLRIVRNPANGQYFAGACAAGRWELLGRADGDDLVELVAIHADLLPKFWEAYDSAAHVGDVPVDTGRVVILDGLSKLDDALVQSMAEPDAESLPWLVDKGVVFAAPLPHPAHVYAAGEGGVALVAVALGPTEMMAGPSLGGGSEERDG